MKQSPELKPVLWDGLVVFIVLLLAAASAVFVWRGAFSETPLTAIVTADGAEVDRFAPADLLETPRTYTCNGHTLRLAAEQRGDAIALRVSSSDCPTQDCVRTGAISHQGESIVCLPARIVIQLTGGTAEKNAVDVVIG